MAVNMNNRRRNYRLIGILMCVIGLVLIFGTLMHEIPVPHASSTRTSIPEEDSLKCRGWFTPEWILLQHEKMSCDSMEDILHETYPTLNASCTDSFSLLFRDGQNEDEYGTLELIQESKNFEMKKGPTHDVKNPFHVSISGKGMHWNMHVTSSLHGGMWLVQPVSLGIYVDSYELLELERKNLLITRALTGHIEVEKPSYASSLHLVAIWFNLSSENGTETTSSYPLHLRYGAPTWNGDKYETVHFPPPLIQYVKMEDMQTSLENGPDFTQVF